MTNNGAATAPQVVRVKRELLAACMTCPLCHKLFRQATTISECLHTFCRKCILDKLNDEEVDCCPICNIDLGCVPVEKLRPDHSLQDVRAKIFPLKRRKVNAPEMLSIPLPVRRKERSLSSLVISTPRVGTKTTLTGRRTRAVARRAAALHGASPPIDERIQKEDDIVEDSKENSTSPDTLIKMTHQTRQNFSNAEPSNRAPKKDAGNGGEPYLDKAELWKPLNCLVEVANRTKPLKSRAPSPAVKTEETTGHDSEMHIPKPKFREHPRKFKVQDNKNSSSPISPVLVKARIFRGTRRRKRENGASAQALLDAGASKRERRTSPIWFSLVASAHQEGRAPLPQLSANYLRIKDGDLPISLIHKYLVRKLDLASENEVEIMCGGHPVGPKMALHSLLDLCLPAGLRSSHKVQASVGSSARDFVMVLSYRRRVPAS